MPERLPPNLSYELPADQIDLYVRYIQEMGDELRRHEHVSQHGGNERPDFSISLPGQGDGQETPDNEQGQSPRTIGLEIEFHDDESAYDYDVSFVSHFRNSYDTPSGWNFAYDGSCGGEAVSEPIKIDDVPGEIDKVIKYLRNHNIEVNDNCSIHVHVGANDLRNIDIASNLTAWADSEHYIYDLFKPFSHRQERYCKPFNTQLLTRIEEMVSHLEYEREANRSRLGLSKSDLAFVWAGNPFRQTVMKQEKYLPYRYFGFNLTSLWLYGTIEFRLFNGTLDPELIKAYALFAHDFVEFMRSYPFISSQSARQFSVIPNTIDWYFDVYYHRPPRIGSYLEFTVKMFRELFKKFRHGDFLAEVLLPA